MFSAEITLIKKILIYFLAWQILMFALVKLADVVLPYQPSFPYFEELVNSGLSKWLYSRANFDGVHYLGIAKNGYLGTYLIQAFFPVYPFLIKILSLVIHSDILSGLIISNLSLLGCLYFGYKLANHYFNERTANHWLLLLLTFPTSFFLGAVYTESLFLLLILAGWWYHTQKKNLISGLLIGLSSGVRLVGLMMILAFCLEWLNKNICKIWCFLLAQLWDYMRRGNKLS
jgi:Gpi18-like mannosyltransferase